MFLTLRAAVGPTPTPLTGLSSTPSPGGSPTPSPASTPTPSPSSTLTPGLTSHQGVLVLVLIVVGIIAAGVVVFCGRKVLQSTQATTDVSFVRSWIAISLVIGLLIFCGAALLGTNTTLQSLLFGGLVASVGSAIAFYFAAQAGAAALNAVTGQAVVAPTAFSAIQPPGGKQGQSYTYTIAANGSPAPVFQVVDGTLPAGLILDASGTLHGTATTEETSTFKVGAFNGNGLLISPELTVTIAP